MRYEPFNAGEARCVKSGNDVPAGTHQVIGVEDHEGNPVVRIRNCTKDGANDHDYFVTPGFVHWQTLLGMGVEPYKIFALFRLCLGTDGTARYIPWFQGDDDYSATPMDPEDALHFITGGGVACEIAARDPKDDKPHNYESLFDDETNVAEGTTKTTLTLCRI